MYELDKLVKDKDAKLTHTKFIIHQEDKKSQEEYGKFMSSVEKILESKNAPIRIILIYIISIEHDHKFLTHDMYETKDIKSFMSAFSQTPTWWNFDTSAKIACQFGGDTGLKLVERYEENLNTTLLQQTSFDLPIIFEATELEVKMNHNVKEFSEATELDVIAKTTELLKTNPMELLVLCTQEDCVKLTLLFSSANEIKVDNFQNLFEDLGINFVKINK